MENVAIDTNIKRYQLLSDGFWNVPTADYLDELAESLPLFETGSELSDKGVGLIKAYLNSRDDGSLHELAVDFTSTFIGQHSDDPFPYESIYTSEGRLLKQESCDDVCEIYRANGFEQSVRESNEPEDYLATMFSFLAFLETKYREQKASGVEAEAAKTQETSEDFKERHLRNWIPRFREDVEEKAETDFYKGLAYLAEQAVL